MSACAVSLTGASLAAAAPAACGNLGSQSTDFRPGLAGLGGSLWMAWTGTNGNGVGNLNVVSTTDGACFGTKTTLPQQAASGPAVASWNGKLWMAFVGVNGASDMGLMSSSDGVHWSAPLKLAESSHATPALVAYQGKLYLAWTGTDAGGHLNIASTTDGTHFTKQEFASDTTPSTSGPALTQFTETSNANILELAWEGTNSQDTVWAFQSDNGTSWRDHTNTEIPANGTAPALSPGSSDVIASELNINGTIDLFASLDGVDFGGDDTGFFGPSVQAQALAHFGNDVWMAFTEGSTLQLQPTGL